MEIPSNVRSKALSIDAALLERMGMLARRHPGRTVSLARDGSLSPLLREKVVLHVDGEAALEVEAGPPDEPIHAA